MTDLRDALERERGRVSLPGDALVRMLDKRRRRARRQRVTALVIGLSIAVVVVGVLVQGGRLVGDRPVPDTPGRVSYDEIAGTYVTVLRANDPDVRRLGLEGRYTMRLRPTGVLLLSVPAGFPAEGLQSIVFRLSGNMFTVNAFTNLSCANTVGTYRWSLDQGVLNFFPLDEPCELRAALFSTRAWSGR